MPTYGDISMERDPFAPAPVGGMRVNPDPLAARPSDPKAALALKLAEERKRRMREEAAAKPAIDVSEVNPRTGRPYEGNERVKLVGTGPINGLQMTDIATLAMEDNTSQRAPITATINGQNYTYTPRIRVGDQKAQFYLKEAESRRAAQVAEEEKAYQRRRAEEAERVAREERQLKLNMEYDKGAREIDDKARKDLQDDKRFRSEMERDELNNKVLAAQAETAAYDNSVEGRRAKARASVGEKMVGSNDSRVRRAGAGLVGESIGVDNFENAVRGDYEQATEKIRPLVEQYKEAMRRGFLKGPNKKAALALKSRIQRAAQDAGLTPEETDTLMLELESDNQDPFAFARGLASSFGAPVLGGIGGAISPNGR